MEEDHPDPKALAASPAEPESDILSDEADATMRNTTSFERILRGGFQHRV